MERMSVFLPADTEVGYVQAVIVADEFPIYQELGFVDSADTIADALAKLKAATPIEKVPVAKVTKASKAADKNAATDQGTAEDFV